MAKATYMYWQKRFNRENPDQDLEEKIQKIQEKNKNYGYRRIFGELQKQGLVVNKKKVQRIRGCGRFLGPELSNSKTASILHRTQTP